MLSALIRQSGTQPVNMWSDTHCHLFDLNHDEFISNLIACNEMHVSSILNIGTDLETSKRVLAQSADVVSDIAYYCAVGISAADVGSYQNCSDWEEKLCTLLEDPRVVALGEIGIDSINDYYAPFEQQLLFFRKQLALAKKHDLPVVVHSRGVEAQSLQEVLQSGVKSAIFHCYTGDVETAKNISDAGFYVSFSGIVTFKRSDFDDVIRAVSLDKLLLETDSPYLAPVPQRGKKNQPAWVSYVGTYVSGVLSMSEDKLARQTSKNFQSFINA